MYLEHYGLMDYPFRLTPDTEFLYMSSGHARAKAYIDYSVWNREGFVVITGEIGCGKTMLLKKLLSELDDETVLAAKLFQTQLDDTEFLQAVLVEFGLNPFNAKKVELTDMLNTFLLNSYQELKQLVLIVDDAHNLSMRALEELRMLSGLETQKEKILHIILVGQPQLNEILDRPEMEQLVQRVRLRFHLRALSLEDVTAYIAHRLKVAGASRNNIFTPETSSIIFKYTGGVPRLINTLCDTALTVAYADDLPGVDLSVMKEAIEELQWQPYERRHGAQKGKAASRDVRTKSGGDNGEFLEKINQRFRQMDNLGPAMTLVADRMARIEGLLARIADHMDANPEKGKAALPGAPRKPGGKDR